jgi:ATP-dependent Clp protease protease subunit
MIWDRLLGNLNGATQGGVTELHLLIQSSGGMVGDGISLYNFFRSLPLDLHVYNTGTVASIAAIAFLGAKRRYTSANSHESPHF